MTQHTGPSVTSIPSIASAIRRAHASNKVCCMYGVQCYRRNPVHYDEYRHPSLEIELGIGGNQSDDDEESDSESSASDMSDEDDDITVPQLPAPLISAIATNPFITAVTPATIPTATPASSITPVASISPLSPASSFTVDPASLVGSINQADVTAPTPPVTSIDPVTSTASSMSADSSAPSSTSTSTTSVPPSLVPAIPTIDTTRRAAWLPEVSDSVAARDGSKFGGQPYLMPNEGQGVTCRCTMRMSFICQLRGDSSPALSRYLPAAMRSSSRIPMFQFWLCKVCLMKGTFGDGSMTSCMRWIDTSQPSLSVMLLQGLDAPNEQALVRWNEKPDYPTQDEATQVLRLDAELLNELQSDRTTFATIRSAKFGGYPCWFNTVTYGQCLQCGATNELLLQLPDYDQLEIQPTSMCRSALILVCPQHRNNFKLLIQRQKS